MFRPGLTRAALLRASLIIVSAFVAAAALAQDAKAPKEPVYAPNNRSLLIWDSGGARSIGSGDVANHIACRPDGKRVYVGTDRSVLVVDPLAVGRSTGAGAITSEIHLAQGLPKTESLVQALGVSKDGKRLYVAYRFRTMERMGWIMGDPVVSAYALDARGEPTTPPVWTRLVPGQRDVSSIFGGRTEGDPIVLYHDLPVAFTRLDHTIAGDGAFKTTVLDPKSPLKRPERVIELRPCALKDGRVLIPLVDGESWVVGRYDPAKNEIVEVFRGRGAAAQCLAVSSDEKLLFAAFDRLRVHDLASGEQKASFVLTQVAHALCASSDGTELYANCGRTILVLDSARNFQIKAETSLETVSRELAIGAKR